MYAGVVIITINPYVLYDVVLADRKMERLFEYFPQNLKTQCYTGFAASPRRTAPHRVRSIWDFFGMSSWAKPQPWIEGSLIVTV